MAGFDNGVMLANNVDFTGSSVSSGSAQVTLNGQLLIGSTVAPNIRVATLSAGTGVVITNGAGTIGIAISGSVAQTLTGNSGPAISPSSGNWNVLGTGSFTTSGLGNTLTLALNGLVNHAVLIGAGTPTITNVGPIAATGAVLQSNGLGSDPGFSTATYPSVTTINQILYSSAANTVTGLATANSATLVTTAAGVPVFTASMTDGQIVFGDTAGTPTVGSLTSTGGTITITPGAGTLNIDLAGGTLGIDSIAVQATTAPGVSPVVPTALGLVTINGTAVAAQTIPIQSRSIAVNELQIEAQRASASASTNATQQGLASFDSASFSVDANGWVQLTGGGLAIDSILPDSGTSPVVPTAGGAVSIIGSGSTTTVGGLNSLTVQLTGLTNHAVLVGAGTTTITKVGPSASTGQILQNNAAADPSYSTATYPSTTTANRILYSSSNDVVGQITSANNAMLVTDGSGVPSLTASTYITNTSFTPVLSFGGASVGITYGVQQAYYTRIGNTVFIHVWILLTSKGSSTGTALISGLPFTIKSQTSYEPMFSGAFGAFTGVGGATPALSYNFMCALGVSNSTTMQLILSGPTLGTLAGITNNTFTNTSEMAFSGFYDV